MRTLIAALLLACLLSPTAQAVIVDEYVTSSANSGPGSLQQAILDANLNDVRHNGTYIHIQLANNDPVELTSSLPSISARRITIAGDPGYRPVIDGKGSHQLFKFTSNNTVATVHNLELQFGQSVHGGCIQFTVTGQLSIKNVYFFSCEAKASTYAIGGAIYAEGSLQVSTSQFVANYVNADTYANGGAIYAEGALQISASQFLTNYTHANVYANGGAIYVTAPNKSLTITDSQFIGNKVVGADATGSATGGAIDAGEYIDVSIEHSSFEGNEALTPAHPGFGRGGAISALANQLQITRSSLVSNKAEAGGAIYYFHVDQPTETNIDIRNTSFILNKASGGSGGAIKAIRGMLTLRNNSFWHNSATQPGNNLAGSLAGGHLASMWNNLFTQGDGSSSSCAIFAAPASAGYNVLPNADCGLGTGPGDQITTGLGIIGLKLDSIDVASVWMVQDSPAVEGGNPAAVDDNTAEACPELDAFGNARPSLGIGLDGSGPPVLPRCDIGAWESPGEAPLFHGSFDDPLLGYE